MLFSWTAYDEEEYSVATGVIATETMVEARNQLDTLKVKGANRISIDGMVSELNTLSGGLVKRPAYTKSDLDSILDEYAPK